MTFDKSWEKNIYLMGKHLNSYPYDTLVSIVARKFFHIPKKKRRKIKVLDLGYGAGNNAKFLAESGFDVYGIDGSKTATKICKERFEKWNLKGNFVEGDFSKLPYKDNFFDLVIDRESLYSNQFDTIKKAIKEVYKKTKNKGLFVSFIYNSYHPEKGLGTKIESNTYNNFKEGSSFYKTGVAHFVDLKEVLGLYSKFKIENIIRHSMSEVYDKEKKFIEYDEYIIIAKKQVKD